MSTSAEYFPWLESGEWIRVGARAIIFNQARDKSLIEKNPILGDDYYNFIGGGVEVGETLEEAVRREVAEETTARIVECNYLFVVENFFPHGAEVRHGLGHYFEIVVENENVEPKNASVKLGWFPPAELRSLDLRPSVVRDLVAGNEYRNHHHVVSRGK